MEMKNYLKLRWISFLFTVGAFILPSCSKIDERITNLENAPKCYTTADFQEFLTQEITKQTTEQKANIEEHTKKIADIRQDLTGAEERLKSAETELSSLNERANATNERVFQLESILANAEQKIQETNDLAQKAESDAKEAHDYAARLESELGATNVKVDEAKQAADVAQRTADLAQADIDRVKQEVADAKSEIDVAKQAAADARTAADKAQLGVDKLSGEVSQIQEGLNKVRNDLDDFINEMQSNVAIKKVETLANGDIKVTYKDDNGNDASFTTSNVACAIDKTIGIATFTINGTDFNVPIAKQFISSIVAVSGTYIDVSKQHKVNVIFNTTDGKVLEATPNPASFKIFQGLTKSTALEECSTLKIQSINKVTDSPVENEYEIAFETIEQEYKGIHLYWKVGTDQQVMSPAFGLIKIPIAQKIYLTNQSNGTDIEIREQHSHGGSSCSNLPLINKGASNDFAVKISLESVSGGGYLPDDKYESVSVEIMKFDADKITPIVGKDMTVEDNAKDRSYYVVYDIDLNGSANGLDGSIGTAHTKGFDYDYYNGNKISYNQDIQKISILKNTPSNNSYFDTSDTGVTASVKDKKTFTVSVSASANKGLYAVIVLIKRTDDVYARGIAYLWVN